MSGNDHGWSLGGGFSRMDRDPIKDGDIEVVERESWEVDREEIIVSNKLGEWEEAKKLLIESAGRAAGLIEDGLPRSNASPEEVYNEANEIESAIDRVLQLLGMESTE